MFDRRRAGRSFGSRPRSRKWLSIGAFTLLFSAHASLSAQGVTGATNPSPAAPPSDTAPVAITLDEAISRARANEPGFAAAVAASRVNDLDRSIARAALLPSVTYHNQFIYTQPAEGATGSGNASVGSTAVGSAPRFIANNAVHEYASQGIVTETIGLQQFTAVSRASAAAAVASAETRDRPPRPHRHSGRALLRLLRRRP